MWVARGGAREAPPVESRAPAGAVGPHVSRKPCNCENTYLWKFVFEDLWIRDFWYLCVCKHVKCVLARRPPPLLEWFLVMTMMTAMTENGKRDDDAADDATNPLILRPRLFQRGTFFYSSDSFARPFPVCLWNPRTANGRKLNSCEKTFMWRKKNVTKYSADLNKQTTKVVPVVSDTQFGSEMAWDSPIAKTRSFWPEL